LAASTAEARAGNFRVDWQFPKKEPIMQYSKMQRPVRQPELPKKGEPVQKQPANDRPIEGQGVTKDERAQEQPADKKRALQNK
jgi:hypothetical protein